MRKYLQKPTQNCRTIFRKTLYSFLVSTFTFHFRKPFSKPFSKSNTNIFWGVGNRLFSYPLLKSSKNIPQKRPSKNFFTPSLRSGVFGRKPPCFSVVHIILFSYPNYPEHTGPRPSSRGGASLPPPGGGR